MYLASAGSYVPMLADADLACVGENTTHEMLSATIRAPCAVRRAVEDRRGVPYVNFTARTTQTRSRRHPHPPNRR